MATVTETGLHARGRAGPLHFRIADQIREQIRTGVFPPGSRLPTNQELTRRLKVSPVTVQNAIRTLAAEGLVASRRRVGTFVSDRIPTVDGQVGLLMRARPERDDVVQWRYLESVVKACSDRRLECVVDFSLPSKNTVDELDVCLDRWRRMRGTLLISPETEVLDHVASMTQSAGRIVVLSATVESPLVSWVVLDNFGMCYGLAQRLCDLGHRRVAFVRPSLDSPHLYSTTDRIRGVRYAGKVLGLDKVDVVEADRLAGLLASADRPTALILGVGLREYDGIFDMLDSAGLTVPGDISLIGYDAAGMTTPDGRRIAAVDQPFERVAEEAARHLAKTDDGRFQVTIPQTFIEGETIGPARDGARP